MLRTRADTANKTSGKKLTKTRSEACSDDRNTKQTIARPENYAAAAKIRNNKAIGSLQNAPQCIVNGGKRGDRQIAHAQFCHHQRVDHPEHGRLKVIDEMSAAHDGKNRSPARGVVCCYVFCDCLLSHVLGLAYKIRSCHAA